MKRIKKEKHSRSFMKGTSWRVIATCDTIFLSWFFTGGIATALKIGGSEVLTKIGLFYVHERVWSRFRFGKVFENGVEIKDKHYRSVIKGISWRFFGTMDTILLAMFWTGDYRKAFAIGFAEVITKVLLFWLHERFWLRVKWGQEMENDNGSEAGVSMPEPVMEEIAAPALANHPTSKVADEAMVG